MSAVDLPRQNSGLVASLYASVGVCQKCLKVPLHALSRAFRTGVPEELIQRCHAARHVVEIELVEKEETGANLLLGEIADVLV